MSKPIQNKIDERDSKGMAKWFYLLLLIIFLPILVMGFVKLENWHKDHYIQTNVPIGFSFKPLWEIKTKEPPKIIEKKITLDYTGLIDTPIKKYICDKFGPLDCKIALAVAASEGLSHAEDDWNGNTNGSIDVGVMRINSIHFKQAGCSLKEVVDQYKNVDCAYLIWKDSGWGAWSSVTNGSYLSKL